MKSAQLIGLRALNESSTSPDSTADHVFLQKKKMLLKTLSFRSQCVQEADFEPDHAPALHVATNFSLRGNDNDFIYSRSDCPTRARAERSLEMMEGGKAILFSSGMAAITTLFLAMQPSIVLLCNVGYTGTLSWLSSSGLVVTKDAEQFVAHEGKNKVIFVEAIRNPDASLADLSSLSALAKQTSATLCVDATFATPVLTRPVLAAGAVVVHSLSKFVGGHSDVLAGCVATDNMGIFMKMRHLRHNLGNVPGNLECFLLIRSFKTLVLRVLQQAKSARKICDYLGKHPRITAVLNGAISDPKLWQQLLESGGGTGSSSKKWKKYASPCFSIVIEGDAKEFLSKLVLFEPATSLGGVCSSADWRHRWNPGENEKLIRLSVGVEDPDDLINDLKQALN